MSRALVSIAAGWCLAFFAAPTKGSAAPSDNVFLRDPNFSQVEWHTAKTGRERERFMRETRQALRVALAKALKARRAPSTAGDRGWLVEVDLGEVIDSESMRHALGFGPGGTGINGRVKIYQLSSSSRIAAIVAEIPAAQDRLSPSKAFRVVPIREFAARCRDVFAGRPAVSQNIARKPTKP